MNFWQAAALGAVQGLTEFLPISSSAHLVLVQHLLGFHHSMLAFDVMVHLATLLAVLIYFAADLGKITGDLFRFAGGLLQGEKIPVLSVRYPGAVLAFWLVAATVPTAAIGVIFNDYFEKEFGSITGVGLWWIVTGIALALSRYIKEGSRTLETMNLWDALLIGTLQGAAIIPAVSRSGATILISMIMGFSKKEAARFSFLLSIPAILGAGVLELKDGMDLSQMAPFALAAAFLSALVISYLTIALLLKTIQKGSFFLFGFYCIAAGIFTLVYARIAGLS